MIQVIHRAELPNALPDGGTSHQFEGQDFGDIALSFFWTDALAGTGPRLHQHPYPELFVIQEGNVTFTVGGETIEASQGQIVIAPAGQPHRFVSTGTGQSRHIDIHPTGRMNSATREIAQEIATTQVIRRNDLPQSETSALFEGQEFGGIPVSFFWTDAPRGTGPRLHRHPYAEVFVVQDGSVNFTVGHASIEATAGQIVVAPAGEPHRFVNTGPGRSRHLDIHVSGRMSTEWLDE